MSSRPRRVAVYTRVSTRHQAERAGADLQQRALLDLAKTRGWEVVDTFHEQASGQDRTRPELARMMRLVRRGQVDVVAVWRFDRFARSTAHLFEALEEFRALKVDFVSHQEALDTTTPMGRAMFAVVAAVAELEHALIRERVQAGVDAARERGVQLGRPRAVELDAETARQAVIEHGSERKAARALGVTRSTLRRRLAEAEDAYFGRMADEAVAEGEWVDGDQVFAELRRRPGPGATDASTVAGDDGPDPSA